MIAAIMAGGKGTRISSVARDIPKPMIEIEKKPVLLHEIECLKRQGLTDILLITGYLGDCIEEYFRDGSDFGVHITYFREKEPLGTAGALFYLKHLLREDFFLLNGDILFDIDFARLLKFHKEKDALATIFTHPNSHPFDSAVILADADARVTGWLHQEDLRIRFKNRVNAGIHILSPKVLDRYTSFGKMDLDRDILKPLIPCGRVFAYDSPEYVKDMGTPERYHAVCRDFLSGKTHAKNLKEKQKAVFLDRDGTINEYCGFITKPDQIMLLPGAAKAIRQINKSEFLAIVISNQPVIARGECTFEELSEIHNQLETLLGEQGAYLDAIYYCPHHPDGGFPAERPELKIDCDCRKPKPGLILQAARDYHIDVSRSYMVGDSVIDVLAGHAAGCKAVLLGDHATDSIPSQTIQYPDLYSFILDMLPGLEEK